MKKESNESTKELVKDIFTNNSNEVKPLKLSVTLHGILGKEKCLLIEKRYNEYDNLIEQNKQLLEHLKAVTYEYEVALKLLAEAGSFEFNPNQNNLIINSKAEIQ